MIERIRRTEWPLVAFTLGMQVAAGLAIAAAVGACIPGSSPAWRFLPVAAAAVAALAMASSLLHLGRPRSGWRSLLHLRTSPLSREVLASLLFLAAAIASVVCVLAVPGATTVLALTTAALGMAAVLLGATVYLVPTQPAWNCWTTPVSFVATSILVAGLAVRIAVPGADLAVSRLVASVLILTGSAALVLSAVMVEHRRSPGGPGTLTTTLSYCALLGAAAIWMLLRPLAVPPAAGTTEAAILLALLALAALQRSTLYRRDRLAAF